MRILVTGSAGFIGFYTAMKFVASGHEVVGIDNLNRYYDIRLKYARAAECGFTMEQLESGEMVQSTIYPNFRFIKRDISESLFLEGLFRDEKFDMVCNLAAQAGVRYSLEAPFSYIQSNIVGFLSILEACRRYPVKHLIYASSSSVYGMNREVPFKETDSTDEPVSLYAATKKADEVMAHSYSSLYGIPVTGLRFFTVYGPWGRPDMAPMLFMKAAVEGRPIKVFNNGELYRDFTYIDDIAEGISAVAEGSAPVPDSERGGAAHSIFNIGNSQPVALLDFINTLESVTGKEITKEFSEMQPGDVYQTYADTTALKERFGYSPSTPLKTGITKLYEWYSSHPSLF